MDKEFDLHKGGQDNRQEFGSGHQYQEPKSPAITVREHADKIRDPLEFEAPAVKELNHSRHLHAAAAKAIPPGNPEEIESNALRPFDEAKGGICVIKDDGAGREYKAPVEPKIFRGRKP